ncbi:MAG: riboflavin kinase [Kiritimatiellia bacterium]
MRPPAGVYAAKVWVGDRCHYGAGYRAPGGTASGDARVLFEVHLLDFQGDLYGRKVEVALVKRMRAPLPPDQVPDLAARIRADVESVRAYFSH